MICFINRSTVDYDVRLHKYVQACKETKTPYFVIGWDRLLNAKFVDEHEYQMKKYLPYAQGKKIWPSIKWFCFIWYYLIKNFRKYKVIHACNMENVLFTLPFKLLGKKIVFDIYDSKIIQIEKKLASIVDCLILPAEKRLEQIGVDKSSLKRFLEIENVPTFNISLKPVEGLKREKIYLSYVGVFQKEIRGIENLVYMVLQDERFVLDIAGVGDDLDRMIQNAAAKCERIHYHGKVQYSEALEIMNNSDFIVALYYPYMSNHIYAAPNKSYEALFLQTPIITSKGTLVGDKVLMSDTGYVVDDTIEGLSRLFDNVNTDEFRKRYLIKCQNSSRLWKEVYADYKTKKIEGEYLKTISGFANRLGKNSNL